MSTYITDIDIQAGTGFIPHGSLLLEDGKIAGVFPDQRREIARQAEEVLPGGDDRPRQEDHRDHGQDLFDFVVHIEVLSSLTGNGSPWGCRSLVAYFPLRYSSMLFAAILPAPIAEMTVAAPVTASPPA